LSEAEAIAVLNRWLQTRPMTDTPPELFSLVGALPPNPQLEPVYAALAEVDPSYLPVQLRLVQVTAQRDPAAARVRVTQLVARNRGMSDSVESYLLQGQLAQAVGDARQAEQAFQTVLAKQPDNIEALVGLGAVSFEQRQFDSAQRYYTQAIALQPGNTGVQRSLIEVQIAQDNRLAAMQQLEQLQIQQGTGADSDLAQRRQQLSEEFLQRRGFQPPWERY
jgi:Flp pilus assembly protein TadD